MTTTEEIIAAFNKALEPIRAQGSDVLVLPPTTYAILKAKSDWRGRGRRRIKREVNKAYRKARDAVLKTKTPH